MSKLFKLSQSYIGQNLRRLRRRAKIGNSISIDPKTGHADYPIIRVDRVIDRKKVVTWGFWCPWCLMEHWHGAGEGHRTAHCWPESPWHEKGYVLIGPNVDTKDRR